MQALDNFYFILYPDADPRFLCQIKENGDFKELIGLYRRILTSARNIKDPGEAYNEAKELSRLVKNIDIKSIWEKIDKDYEEFFKKTPEHGLKNKVKVPISHLIPVN